MEIQIRNFTPSFTLCRETTRRHFLLGRGRGAENSRNGVLFVCLNMCSLPSHCPHCIIYSLLTTKTEPLFVSRYCARYMLALWQRQRQPTHHLNTREGLKNNNGLSGRLNKAQANTFQILYYHRPFVFVVRCQCSLNFTTCTQWCRFLEQELHETRAGPAYGEA